MCGIIGMHGSDDEKLALAMLRHVAHRGPDGQGILSTGHGILGHARLAIIDVEGGVQPMRRGCLAIAFNGEIYNHRQLASEHLRGVPMHTRSDTEVLLALYERMGPSMVALLQGMFAFAILDGEHLFLARDPLGIKPLYHGRQGDVHCFASEIRALGEATDEVGTFPPGHWYHSQKGWHRFYSVPRGTHAFEGTRLDALDSIRQVTGRAVRKRMLADVPVGVCLSGGLDSSIIALHASQMVPTLHTFAVGMEGGADLAAARTVASFLGTRHHELVYTGQQMIDALPVVVRHLESCDAALMRSAVPNHFLAQLASRHVKVVLTGEGADELYAGYDYMARFTTPESLHEELLHVIEALHHTNLQRADRIPMAHGLEARVPFLDIESVALALSFPAAWKLHGGSVPKQLLREAYRGLLPEEIVDRPKMKFSRGAGSWEHMRMHAEQMVSDELLEIEKARIEARHPGVIPNKETLLYHHHLRGHLKDSWIFPNTGASRSL